MASQQNLGERIITFLRERDAPASSHMLAERFLSTSVRSEELATRLLRPALEPLGAVYLDERGWVTEAGASGQAMEPAAVFAGAFDPNHQIVHLAAARADAASEPLPAGVPPPAGATLILLEPRQDAGAVRDWMSRTGQHGPVSIRSLRSVVRGVVRLPRGAGLSEICAALGVRWLETEEPEGVAVAIAACVAEAAARRALTGADDADDMPAVALPAGITPDMLAALPESPGVYRFQDVDGALLYVGKAANLRRRVGSYFKPAAARRPRRFQGRIHTMTHEVVGSELEALLREARLIVRRAPPGNIQMQIHERAARYDSARAFALLLPDAAARAVSVILVRDGRYLGYVKIGPRGGGLAGARKLLGRAVCATPPRRAAGPGGTDRDTAILRSWLAKNGESVSRLDLDVFTKADEAASALADAVRQLLAEPGVVIFR